MKTKLTPVEENLIQKIDNLIQNFEVMADEFRKMKFEAWALSMDHCIRMGHFTRKSLLVGLENLKKLGKR